MKLKSGNNLPTAVLAYLFIFVYLQQIVLSLKDPIIHKRMEGGVRFFETDGQSIRISEACSQFVMESNFCTAKKKARP